MEMYLGIMNENKYVFEVFLEKGWKRGDGGWRQKVGRDVDHQQIRLYNRFHSNFTVCALGDEKEHQ